MSSHETSKLRHTHAHIIGDVPIKQCIVKYSNASHILNWESGLTQELFRFYDASKAQFFGKPRVLGLLSAGTIGVHMFDYRCSYVRFYILCFSGTRTLQHLRVMKTKNMRVEG